jgi:hypothetical protein
LNSDSGNTLDDGCPICSTILRKSSARIELLELLLGREADDFDGIATSYESQFHYHYEWRELFAASREKVTHFIRTELGVQRVMITVCFTSMTLIINQALLKGKKSNQDYFISRVLPELVKENGNY